MKKRQLLLLLVLLFILTGCEAEKPSSTPTNEPTITITSNPTTKPTTKPTAKPTKKSNSSSSSKSSFTNKYGTPTTMCAHSLCTNYIASSGDTNCCTIHSHKCRECGIYIDEDATYCMDCIKKGLGK